MKLPAYLTFPGNGVHTVHTAKDRKQELVQAYYGISHLKEADSLWKKKVLADFPKSKTLLLGAPSDAGAGIVRGSNWGPLFLRNKMLQENLSSFLDLGDIRVVPHLLHDKYLNLETINDVQKALKLSELQPVSPLSMLEEFSKNIFSQHHQKHLLTLGGDHSISWPLTKSWIESFSDSSQIGVLHFDAHTDLLDQRLGIDYCFGSWSYHCAKKLADPANLVQVGIRSSGYPKEHWEKSIGVKQFWSKEVLKEGASNIAQRIIKHFQAQGIKTLYLSFDIDCFDSSYANATGTPEKGGLAPFHALEILSQITQHFKIHSADLVEVAPFISYASDSGQSPEPNTTIESAFSIINFLFEYWERND